jgi:hypothetical protein
MMRDTSLNMIEKDAIFCFGMCKMTVTHESHQTHNYKELKFVELLEMIGRIASHKYRHTDVEL